MKYFCRVYDFFLVCSLCLFGSEFSAASTDSDVPQGPVAASMTDGLNVQLGGGSSLDVPWIDLLTVVETAQKLSSLSQLRKIYDKTEMGFKLEQSRHITVFMPNNKALRALPVDLLQLPYEDAVAIMQAHIIPELVKLSELDFGNYSYGTMEGLEITIVTAETPESNSKLKGSSSKKSFTGHITFEGSDIPIPIVDPHGIDTANGEAYIIEAVILPPAIAEKYREEFSGSSKSRTGPLRSQNSSLFSVPDHIQATNDFHWRSYGRVGGVPELDNQDDDGANSTQQPDSATLSDGTTNSDSTAPIGVLQSNSRKNLRPNEVFNASTGSGFPIRPSKTRTSQMRSFGDSADSFKSLLNGTTKLGSSGRNELTGAEAWNADTLEPSRSILSDSPLSKPSKPQQQSGRGSLLDRLRQSKRTAIVAESDVAPPPEYDPSTATRTEAASTETTEAATSTVSAESSASDS